MIKCPKCGYPVSKKWIFLSGTKNIHQCPNCNFSIEWMPLKGKFQTISFALGTGVAIFIRDTFGRNIILSGVIIAFSYLVVGIIIPALFIKFIKTQE